MDAIELLIAGIMALIALGAIVSAVTVVQIRRFAARVREDERLASEEAERARQASAEIRAEDTENNDEAGADA